MKTKLSLALIKLVFLVACKSLVPVMDINNHSFAKEKSLDEVEKAILAGAASRGWSSSIEKPGHIVSSINVRNKHQAVIDIFYTGKEYSINYKESSGLKYENGNIHPNYNNWMINLRNSIDSELYRL